VRVSRVDVGRVVEEPHERAVHAAHDVVDLAQLVRLDELAGLEAVVAVVSRVVDHEAQLSAGATKRARDQLSCRSTRLRF